MRKSISIEVERLEGRRLMTGLSLHLATNHAVYSRGEPVVITLVETNTSRRDIRITEGPSVDGFTVTQGGAAVWRSNAGFQPQFLTSRTLHPGQSTTISATWDGRPNEATIANPYGPFVVKSEAVTRTS